MFKGDPACTGPSQPFISTDSLLHAAGMHAISDRLPPFPRDLGPWALKKTTHPRNYYTQKCKCHPSLCIPNPPGLDAQGKLNTDIDIASQLDDLGQLNGLFGGRL